MSDTYPDSTEEVKHSTQTHNRTNHFYVPEEGQIIDQRYKLAKKIGEGGMGYVYSAKQLNISRQVVVKLLKPEFCVSDEQISRFKREAELASKLSHPNCVTIHDFGFHQDAPYIVMEFLEGMPLSDLLYYRKNQLSFNEIVGLISQVCDALEVARNLKVVHRDLKPENIFVLKEPQGNINVKVLDFGIAKLAHTHPEASQSNLTRGDMVFGTPQYMAPEQIRGKPLDHKADVYALTVILFEMISGKVPFDSEDPGDLVTILTHHLRDPIPEITVDLVHPQTVSILDKVNHLVREGMAKKPETRLKTTAELKQRLTTINLESTELQEEDTQPAIPIKDDQAERLVTRPSLLFSSIGDHTDDGLAQPQMTVADLIPSSFDHQESAEPSLSDQNSPTSRSISNSNYTHGKASESPQSHHNRQKSVLGSLVKAVLMLGLLALFLIIALTFPQSPLNDQVLNTYLPQQLIVYVQKVKTFSHPLLSPIYTRLALSQSTPSPMHSSAQKSVHIAQSEHSSPQPATVPQKVESNSKTLLSDLAVLVIQTEEDCKLSITNSPMKMLKVGELKRVPVRFGNHNIKCINAQNHEFKKSLKVSDKRKYKVQCHFSDKLSER